MKLSEYRKKRQQDPEYIAAKKEMKPLLGLADRVFDLRLERGQLKIDFVEERNSEPPDTICHHMRLLLDSVQLALKLGQLIDYKRVYTGIKEYQASNVRIEAWQRHWRRVAKFNARFDENLYIPDWYIAEMKERE